ncbi:MAG: hypothetical protein A2790_16475 [Phenylobacterium sp. RIFCSPHIGHO2_01_FULL_69_31]|jgi:hypothetical protein|uniref:PEPxxWA-CTERM sorting domain-containing protein n=1 Tax=Phenylobacterium sp. RIFCSPHIGHO2_01_FULL_69_31 TaxID=1801944 RepID=UPI0008AE8869|nr:PEPxxWA-CTERM sorting domain-containing protein [Phenylobacterium sp. RIFCSPHIGHO2_01_FULL_69_31]OHB27621.1 MAG: hypothetical protein A2790_16475 [Phenylobacterium sp. RIFCSPHIGHO2_01_FULL_69_31]
MKTLAVAAVAAGLAFAGSADAATNLLTNGSFESGLSGWTLSSTGAGQGYSPTVVIATDGVGRGYPNGAFGEGVPADNAPGPFAGDGGGYAAYFSSDVPDETLSQSIALAAGWYEVGFDAYLPLNGYNNPNDATFTATVGTYTWTPVLLKSGAGAPQVWTHYSAKVYVNPAQANVPSTFTFKANGYPAVDVLVDRVYVTTAAVPEPTTWALMIMGFGGAGAMIRRRRLAAA